MDTHQDIINPKLKTSEERRVEPPIPVEPIIKSNADVKQEKSVKIDNGNTISKDAINKEDEELEKRPEIELLEKLKSHEKEEKKILAESKKILEELKGARHVQFEKNKMKPVDNVIDSNFSTYKEEVKKIDISLDEKKNQLVKDKLPLPLVLKEANRPYKTKIKTNRDKRDLTSTVHSNYEEKEENCDKNEKSVNKDAPSVKHVDNIDIIENISISD